MHLVLPLALSVGLFGIGTYGLLVRRNLILILMSLELMLNGANISMVAFDVFWADVLRAGQSFAIFIITIAAAEIGLGLAILLLLYRARGTIAVDEATDLRETPHAGATSRDGESAGRT
ncbi:MAG: NADH-quinone oxidoreductase subunit NuoK [Actinomycetes bacterium]